MKVGPDQGLERLYEEHAERLWRALLAYTADPEIASDALAEAFAQYLQRGPGVLSPIGWVWRTAFRVAAGELKARRQMVPLREEGSYDMPERLWDLMEALKHVPTRQRSVLVLHYYADLPTKEIASILGNSQATVRVQLSQGRKRVRRFLEETDG